MNIPNSLDTLLDRTIVLGYGNLGLQARQRQAQWKAPLPRMDGKSVLITGAASGIGLAAAKAFAQLGAEVKVIGRNDERARDAEAQILELVPGAKVQALACDVSSLKQVRALAERLEQEGAALHMLVNNAGVMPNERSQSADGHELMFATHVLAPFALTQLLQGPLERAAPARIVNVSSGGMYAQRIPAGDLESEQTSYSPKQLYARTKREEVVITEGWAERLKDSGIVVHAMHPGWVDTKGVREWLPVFRAVTGPIIRTPEQGADTIVWLGAAQEPLQSTGGFWHDRRGRPTRYALGPGEESPQVRTELWEYCAGAVQRALG
jgi:dehydrogenase/reductase SDR family member 12